MKTVRLNMRLGLERSTRHPDGMGGYRLIWTQIGLLWAEMQSSTGRERGAEVGPESIVSWKITVRGAPAGDPRRPIPGQRLRMGRRLFLIEAVAESDTAGHWLTCFAREEDLV